MTGPVSAEVARALSLKFQAASSMVVTVWPSSGPGQLEAHTHKSKFKFNFSRQEQLKVIALKVPLQLHWHYRSLQAAMPA